MSLNLGTVSSVNTGWVMSLYEEANPVATRLNSFFEEGVLANSSPGIDRLGFRHGWLSAVSDWHGKICLGW